MQMYGVSGEMVSSASPTAQSLSASQSKTSPHDKDGLPSWAKSLLSRPSISVRQGIAWGFSPSSEPSSVLVLTAPSGRYVDIRLALSGSPADVENSDFWAFAGTCSTQVSMPNEGGMECMAHGKWLHPIDSNQGFDAVDEGDMFLLANGDCIEVGIMENPASKSKEMYKEYWTGPKPEPKTMTPCVVAETASTNGKGMIVRVGNYCQGIFQNERGVTVERWENTNGQWSRDKRSNAGDEVPCEWVLRRQHSIGDKNETSGVPWEVVEVIE